MRGRSGKRHQQFPESSHVGHELLKLRPSRRTPSMSEYVVVKSLRVHQDSSDLPGTIFQSTPSQLAKREKPANYPQVALS
jgi:hypothetical protein